jgi:hypothetical protein
MNLFFLAALVPGKRAAANRYYTRMWLPAGQSVDRMFLDLISRYAQPPAAMELCAGPTALRGLPSAGHPASAEESNFLVSPWREVTNLARLRELVKAHNARGALVFLDGQWWKFFGEGPLESLGSMTLLACSGS